MGEMKGQGYLYGKPEDAAAVIKRLGELDMLSDSTPEPDEPEQRKSA